MGFQKINNTTSSTIILNQIIDAIKSGEFDMGDRLPTERELAEVFGVSRPTVRQATLALSLIGILEIRQGIGTFVADNSIDMNLAQKAAGLLDMQQEYRHALDARVILMPKIASLAVERATDDDIQKMKIQLDKIAERAKRGALFEKAGLDFNMAIVRSVKNPILEYACLPALTVWFDKEDQDTTWRNLLVQEPDRLSSFHQAYICVYDAIFNRDAELAVKAMQDLLHEVEQFHPALVNGDSNKVDGK